MKKKSIILLCMLFCFTLSGCVLAEPGSRSDTSAAQSSAAVNSGSAKSSSKPAAQKPKAKKDKNQMAGDKKSEQAIDGLLNQIDELEKVLDDYE